MRALSIGGVEDHVHMLLSIPSTMSIAKCVQLLKGNSSKWLHETFRDLPAFEWQEGYGAFSIGMTRVHDTTRYIKRQAEHHKRFTFQDELAVFLQKHGVRYVEADLE